MSWTKERFDFGSGIRFRLFEIEEKQKELHCHDCLEIDLVEEGDGNYIIGGRIYPVRTGDIFVINNSERHLAIHGEHGLKLSVLIFEATHLERKIWKRLSKAVFLQNSAVFPSNRAGSQRLSEYAGGVSVDAARTGGGAHGMGNGHGGRSTYASVSVFPLLQ